MQRTRLETFRQSRVVDIVVVVVVVVVFFSGAYSPVTDNRASQLYGITPRDVVGLVNPVVAHSGPLFCCSRHGGRRRSRCVGQGSSSIRGDAPPEKESLTSPGKGSAGDAAPGEGTAGVSKSLLVRSRIWSTNSCTFGSADTPLAFSLLVGMLAVKSRTPV